MNITLKQKGFTIVELLIVIVVIGILASISIVAYTGIQQRGRDAARFSDVSTIRKTLEIYKATYGYYPGPTSANGGWEESYEDGSGAFMESLLTGNLISKVPVDPINNSTNRYLYYKYGAGDYGCDASKGAFYVLAISDIEASSGAVSSSPGWACTSRNWGGEFEWVTGGFDNS